MQEKDALKKLSDILERESSDSLKLLNNLSDNPICSVSIDRSVPCVTVTWKQYATSAQFRFVLESVLQLLRTHGLHKVLGDDTALPNIPTDDQAWMVADWMPRAIAAGLRAAAGKRSAFYFGKVSVEKIQASVANDVPIRSFDDLGEARQWLRAVNP